MKTNSFILLHDTNSDVNVISEPIRLAGWYRSYNIDNTISIFTNNLNGRLYFEGTLEKNPTENDWFPIQLNNKNYLEYFCDTYNYKKVEKSEVYTIKTNAILIRVKLDRSYLDLDLSDNPNKYVAKIGNVRKIFVAF